MRILPFKPNRRRCRKTHSIFLPFPQRNHHLQSSPFCNMNRHNVLSREQTQTVDVISPFHPLPGALSSVFCTQRMRKVTTEPPYTHPLLADNLGVFNCARHVQRAPTSGSTRCSLHLRTSQQAVRARQSAHSWRASPHQCHRFES